MLFVVVEGYEVFGAEVWVYRVISYLRMGGLLIKSGLFFTKRIVYTISVELMVGERNFGLGWAGELKNGSMLRKVMSWKGVNGRKT